MHTVLAAEDNRPAALTLASIEGQENTAERVTIILTIRNQMTQGCVRGHE